MNDLRELITERDNKMLRKAFDIYVDQEVMIYKRKKRNVILQWHQLKQTRSIIILVDFQDILNEHDLQNSNHCP